MDVILAKSAGFCYGVRRAVDMAEELLAGGGGSARGVASGARLCTLGALIHNPQVVEDLHRRGAEIIDRPEDAQPGDTVLIRAHGVSPEVRAKLAARGAEIADATCPFVAKIHKIAAERTRDGTPLFLLGDRSHPEVQGILGHCSGAAYVYADEGELLNVLEDLGDIAKKKAVFVQQTTANEKVWLKCKKTLNKYSTNAEIFDTICNATLERQREAADLAHSCAAMVVIGGNRSANTGQLAAVCAPYCPVYKIEHSAQLRGIPLPLEGKIGVTAGASTPASIIEEVVSTMSDEILNTNTAAEQTPETVVTAEEVAPQDTAATEPVTEVTAPEEVAAEVTVPEEAVAEVTAPEEAAAEEIPVPKETPAEIPAEIPAEETAEEAPAEDTPKLRREITDEMGFEEALEVSMENQNMTSKTVEGVVTGVTPSEIQVDLVGRKQAGYVPANEYSSNRSADHTQEVKIGDVLNLVIMKTDDNEGTIMCSKRRYDSVAGWKTITDALESKAVIEGDVSEVVKGGVLIYVSGIRVFIPASQAAERRGDPLEDLLGQTVKFKILEATSDRRFKKVVGSIREASGESRKARSAKFWAEAKVGDVYVGRVRSLTNFGAFVDLGGIDGLVHITELSWTRVANPADILSVGQEVEVYIKNLDQERKRISLGYRKEEDSPWNQFVHSYEVGSVVDVTIVSMTTFGAFATIVPGVEGLIHISQISDRRIEKPQDELKIDQRVQTKIIGIDTDTKRVSLSIRALLDPMEGDSEDSYEV
ncbi:MAG: bifunctional 4-hydroxy-3-methylbut-2-enyl diphosphate reductase/30S ribosomal protein S1 [Oscillospiraceae bacterium]|jgi:4-hydroxy-3-methylbut-2-enyl diphosphate reductase|nr:bifunctional 4-hydroxy-3-methylbut-2-enyl diphosphate reductase/30S ribosomal protein S1 [Oscillospiraceae bacterium]